MKNDYCVYCHTFPNGKRYIGITNNIEKRWNNGKGYKTQAKMQNAITKYGWDNVKHRILARGLTEQQAQEIEKSLIAEFDTIKKGYNVSIGGGTAKGTYLLSEVLEAIKNGRRMFGANPLFDFVDDGKFNLELAELCNNAYQAVQHKREMFAGRPFSVTDEIDLAWLWYDMRYYFNLTTAIIRGYPLPKYESPEERLIKIWGLDKLSKKDSTF